MLELVEQFRDQGTVDDLGIGQVRDSFSDALFPGTSTLHTRLRYALFIPWLLQRASRETNAQEMVEEMSRLEFRLIDSPKRGEDYRLEYNDTRPHEAFAFNRPKEVHLGLADPTTPNFEIKKTLPTT